MAVRAARSPRPGPRPALRQPTRPDELLAAACRAIVQRGFSDTRVADIAAEAGVSTGTIHYYFSSKQEILVEALRWASDRLFARLPRDDGSDATSRLAALLRLAIPDRRPTARRDEYVLWIEMWTVVLHDRLQLSALQELSDRWRAFFFDVIRAGVASQEFDPVAPADEVAERLIALVDGLGFDVVIGYRWSTPARMRRLLVPFAAEQLRIDPSHLETRMNEVRP